MELGSGLLQLRTNNGGMNAYRFFRQQAKRQLKIAAKIHVKARFSLVKETNTVCKVLNCRLKSVKILLSHRCVTSYFTSTEQGSFLHEHARPLTCQRARDQRQRPCCIVIGTKLFTLKACLRLKWYQELRKDLRCTK